MANREVNLTKRVQTPYGLRYCRVVLSANGRVKPDAVMVNGQKNDTQKARITWSGATIAGVAGYPWARTADASARRLAKEAELNAINHGVALAPSIDPWPSSLAASRYQFSR